MSLKLLSSMRGGPTAGAGPMPKMMMGPAPMNGAHPHDGPPMAMMANLMNGKLFNFLQNRDLVIQIARKHRELTFSEETQLLYDNLDPASPTVIIGMMTIWSDTANQVLRETCPEFPDFKGTPMGVFVIEMLLQKYEKDPEVRRHLDFMYEFRSMMQSGNLRIGDSIPDVDVVSLDTQQRHSLPSLTTQNERPTVVIASSFS
ncbi:uncharacterized protein [Ptychodera flava]|uniref:uncharacterized protein n=1 Tax=Ptychodera flava TaxID=63121 RepID=UPI003969F06A